MNTTKESSSPRTDAAADEAGCDDETGFYDICKFARQLERECAAYQKDAERLGKALEMYRQLAAKECAIQKVIDELGPLSLWSKAEFEAEVQRRIDAALERDA